ncbi:MAG: tRNA (adenosine(37)-N6)-threonylcarbamoyltransferase complex ATPase subunit type 1 TsaE [Rikenellaceae bacterium]
MKVIETHSLSEFSAAAAAIVEAASEYSVVAFYGQMGAGKTTLISAICDVMGVEQRVTSPTFAIVNEYVSASERTIYHFDVYRINKIDEIYDMGYEEYFYSDGLSLVEWPELIEPLLPEDTLVVKIEVLGEDSRKITIGSAND